MSGFIYTQGERSYEDRKSLFIKMISELIEAGIEITVQKKNLEGLGPYYRLDAPSIGIALELEEPETNVNSANGSFKCFFSNGYATISDSYSSIYDLAKCLNFSLDVNVKK